MLIIFESKVVALGTPGPLLGDNVNTVVTPIWPLDVKGSPDANQITGGGAGATSVFNKATRQSYTVARLTLIAKVGNTQPAYWGGRGSTKVQMAKIAAALQALGMPVGEGSRNDIDLGDIDVAMDANNESWLVICEVR